MAEGMKEMPIQCCLGVYMDLRDGMRGTYSTSSSLEENEDCKSSASNNSFKRKRVKD